MEFTVKARISIALFGFALVIASAASVPWVREKVAYALKLTNPTKGPLVANACTLDTQSATDPDRIYFLSCGGIY